jgi:PTS system nitrogen regulatory IIA component
MSVDDFDIASLADYLHVEQNQVLRLVERGRLPGRRVAGAWRFSAAEIHHWLEQRMGLSTDEELARMEGALRRAAGSPEQAALSIAGLMPIEAIAVPLDARTRSSVITSICALAGGTGWLWDAARMADAVRTREDLYPTALENGVALLHPRRPLASILGQPLVALGRTAGGIPFGGPRGTLTDLFFLVCSVDDRGHLHTLARLSRLLADPTLLGELRAGATAAELHRAIAEHEAALSG